MACSEYRTILYQKHEEHPNILYITLNRPQKMNAISIGPNEMTGELQDAVQRADLDDQVKVVIFKGAGQDFCAGFDLEYVYRVYGGTKDFRPYQSTRLIMDETQLGFARAILNCKKVTMAQIQGWCIEAGIWIPVCCDIAIAAKNAKFAHRGQRLAFGGMPQPLELFMGHTKKIIELLITGRTISGEEAEQIGIITKAVEPELLESEVYNLARAIALLPLDAIVMGKSKRRLIYELTGLSVAGPLGAIYHTLGTNIRYRPEEQDLIFIRDREKLGAREAFHAFHRKFEEALERTRYFRSYKG